MSTSTNSNQDYNISYSHDSETKYNTYFVYGGFIGESQSNVEITNCKSELKLNLNFGLYPNSDLPTFIGGFIGHAFGVNTHTDNNDYSLDADAIVKLNKCRSNGTLNIVHLTNINFTFDKTYAGGFIGGDEDLATNHDVACQIFNCVHGGKLTYTDNFGNASMGVRLGGFIGLNNSDGWGSNNPVIQNCINNGYMNSGLCITTICGFIGINYNNTTNVSFCANGTDLHSTADNPYSLTILGNNQASADYFFQVYKLNYDICFPNKNLGDHCYKQDPEFICNMINDYYGKNPALKSLYCKWTYTTISCDLDF